MASAIVHIGFCETLADPNSVLQTEGDLSNIEDLGHTFQRLDGNEFQSRERGHLDVNTMVEKTAEDFSSLLMSSLVKLTRSWAGRN